MHTNPNILCPSFFLFNFVFVKGVMSGIITVSNSIIKKGGESRKQETKKLTYFLLESTLERTDGGS